MSKASRMAKRLGLTCWLFAGLMMMSSCGNDPARKFTVVVTTDANSLFGDGSNFAIVRVTILDQNGNPPAIGSVARLQVPDGSVNSTGEDLGQAFTDATGTASFTVSCTEEGTLQMVAIYEGERGVLPRTVECQEAPSGDWTLSIEAESRRVGTGEIARLTVQGRTGSGAPVPVGTGITLEVTGGSMQFQSGQVTARLTDDPSGQLSVGAFAPDFEETSTICASFTDDRFGSEDDCVAIIVSDTLSDEPQCIGTYAQRSVPADGLTVTTVNFSVTDTGGEPINEATIDVEAQAGELLDQPTDDSGTDSQTLTTDRAGDAETYILSPIEPDTADISAEATIEQDGALVDLPCTFSDNLVFFPEPTCQFQEMVPDVLGVAGSGVPERGDVSFCFTGLDGGPVVGARVNFEFTVQLAGAALTASSGFTDESGCVRTQLEGGTSAGTVEIKARMPFGLNESACTTGPLPIRGARPSEGGWNLICEVKNIGELMTAPVGSVDVRSTCSYECSTLLRDRFGNPVTFPGTQVFFMSEQGTVVSPAAPDQDGWVTTTYRPNGRTPRDVQPLPGELTATTVDGTVNQRDMLVSIMAFTEGEEAYDDENGNGAYDDGEVFWDQPEPFVDFNDNDQYDPGIGERFVDVETPDSTFNGIWDAPNLTWDGETTIFTATQILLTDRPDPTGAVVFNNGSIIAPGAGGCYRVDVANEGQASLLVYLPDNYRNRLNRTATFEVVSECEDGPESEISRQDEVDDFTFDVFRSEVPLNADGIEVPPGTPPAMYKYETRFRFPPASSPFTSFTGVAFNINGTTEGREGQSCTTFLEVTLNESDACGNFELSAPVLCITSDY